MRSRATTMILGFHEEGTAASFGFLRLSKSGYNEACCFRVEQHVCNGLAFGISPLDPGPEEGLSNPAYVLNNLVARKQPSAAWWV